MNIGNDSEKIYTILVSFQNIGIIVLILTILMEYNRYKKDLFFKENEHQNDDIDRFDSFRKKYKLELLTSILIIGIILFYLIAKWMGVIIFLLYALIRAPFLLKKTKETPTLLKKWWHQSYIREIYVVRARQRRLLSLIPWIGLGVSVFASFIFTISSVFNFFYPEPSYEKLQRYDGVVKGYYYNRKSKNTLVLQLENNETKRFSSSIFIKYKYPEKNWIEKKASVWANQEWGILSGYYDNAVWIQFDSHSLDKEGYEKQYIQRYERGEKYFPRLITSLKWLIIFLLLLWFINRKPVFITDKKQTFSPLVEIILALVGVSSFIISCAFILVLGIQ